MLRLLLLLAILVLQGCFSSKVALTGRDHYSGWSDQARSLAVHSWKYAQLAQNVYADGYNFNVSPFFEEVKIFDGDALDLEGFYAVLYRSKTDQSLVFVFRGTDALNDFKNGNNPINQAQNKLALQLAREIKREHSVKSLIVVGHSLGGGIASHVSLNESGVTQYSFNGSPVFKKDGASITNTRYSIVEYGEVAKLLRVFGREPTQLYTSLDCTKKGNLIAQHSMKKLATCLTQIAATSSSEANDSLQLNNLEREYLPNEIE